LKSCKIYKIKIYEKVEIKEGHIEKEVQKRQVVPESGKLEENDEGWLIY